jgi:uncharacterized protein (DUF1015 family)
VPRFEPFPALRYDLGVCRLDDVTAPPYDVLSDSDVDELGARHAANIVHVDVPREADGPDRYDRAAEVLAEWVATGTLSQDTRPSYTVYRMIWEDETGARRTTVGVIGALEVVDEGAGGVLPHERTTPKAKTDRLDLTRSTTTNLSPVWGLSLAAGLSELLAAAGEPMGQVTVEGVTHVVERVTDPDRIAAIRDAVSAEPVVIADGHHRYAISRTYRDEIRTATGRRDTDAELTMTYIGELVEDQLSVEAIHRIYTGISAASLLGALSSSFETEPVGDVTPSITTTMAERGALCLVHPDGSGTLLTPEPRRWSASATSTALDSSTRSPRWITRSPTSTACHWCATSSPAAQSMRPCSSARSPSQRSAARPTRACSCHPSRRSSPRNCARAW